MQWLADRSLRTYRRLTQRSGFVDFFRQATPMARLNNCDGSASGRRKTGGR